LPPQVDIGGSANPRFLASAIDALDGILSQYFIASSWSWSPLPATPHRLSAAAS
jgi:hypothetical protein